MEKRHWARGRSAIGWLCIALVSLALTGCGTGAQAGAEATFAKQFGLLEILEEITLTELYQEEGGVAFYRVDFARDAGDSFAGWERLPINGETELFLESVSDRITLPSVSLGRYRLIDRSDGAMAFTDASLCIYDAGENVAYYVTLKG